MSISILRRKTVCTLVFLYGACIQALSANPLTVEQLRSERAVLYESLQQGKTLEALVRLQSITPPKGVSSGFFSARELVAVSFAARNRGDFVTSRVAAREAVNLLANERVAQFAEQGERSTAYRLLARLQERVLGDEKAARTSWAAYLKENPRDEHAQQALLRIDNRLAYEAGRVAALERDLLKPGYVPAPAPNR